MEHSTVSYFQQKAPGEESIVRPSSIPQNIGIQGLGSLLIWGVFMGISQWNNCCLFSFISMHDALHTRAEDPTRENSNFITGNHDKRGAGEHAVLTMGG